MGQEFYDTLISELEAVPTVSGLIMTDILTLPEAVRQFIQWVLRRKNVTFGELADYLEGDDEHTRRVIDLMAEKGFLEETGDAGQMRFRIHTSTILHTNERRKSSKPSLWETLGEEPPK